MNGLYISRIQSRCMFSADSFPEIRTGQANKQDFASSTYTNSKHLADQLARGFSYTWNDTIYSQGRSKAENSDTIFIHMRNMQAGSAQLQEDPSMGQGSPPISYADAGAERMRAQHKRTGSSNINMYDGLVAQNPRFCVEFETSRLGPLSCRTCTGWRAFGRAADVASAFLQLMGRSSHC